MKNRISTAIIGLGRAGWHLHFEPLLKNARFEIVAVSDPDPARIEEAREMCGCRGYQNLAELLADAAPELVVVATPNTLHGPQTALILEAGSHCIVEKPLASSYREAMALAGKAEQNERKIFVHHQHLFRDEYRHFQELRDSGVLGDIFHIQCLWASYNRRWDWQTLKKNGGGQLSNTCPHTLSIILPLLNSRVRDVFADLRNIKDSGDCEDHVHLVLDTEFGATADVTVTSASAVPGTKWMLLGRYGSLQSDGKTSRLRYLDQSRLEERAVVDGAAPGRRYLTEELPWIEETRETRPQSESVSFHENVADVLREQAAMTVSLDSALEVTRVIDLAREANRKRSVSRPDSRPLVRAA